MDAISVRVNGDAVITSVLPVLVVHFDWASIPPSLELSFGLKPEPAVSGASFDKPILTKRAIHSVLINEAVATAKVGVGEAEGDALIVGVGVGDGDAEEVTTGFGVTTIFQKSFLPFIVHTSFCLLDVVAFAPTFLHVAPLLVSDAEYALGCTISAEIITDDKIIRCSEMWFMIVPMLLRKPDAFRISNGKYNKVKLQYSN